VQPLASMVILKIAEDEMKYQIKVEIVVEVEADSPAQAASQVSNDLMTEAFSLDENYPEWFWTGKMETIGCGQ
jgi:hypothetical protein